MDTLDFIANRDMRKYFEELGVKCPSSHCDGILDEYEEHGWKPFKAFLMCSKCESRLRIRKLDKGWPN